jgi:hypothetical protein
VWDGIRPLTEALTSQPRHFTICRSGPRKAIHRHRRRPSEKATTVAKLAAAREPKRATGVKVESRRNHAGTRPEVVALAKALARKKPKGGQLILRAISAELEARGFLNERGKPFHHKSVAAMVARRS